LFACAVLASPLLAQTTAPKDPAPASGNAPRVDLDKLKRPSAPAAPSNLFGARSWENKAPPKKAPPPPPPPPPQAPPLPFTYMGRWIERGETTVMIASGNRNFTVREGEKIDPTYLLEKVDADKLVIRYLPLDETQVLPLGAPPAAALAPQQRPNVQLLPNPKRGAARDADDEED
jgi:hypothetical protein